VPKFRWANFGPAL